MDVLTTSCSLDSIQPVSSGFKRHVETAPDADSAVCREHSPPSLLPRGVTREGEVPLPHPGRG